MELRTCKARRQSLLARTAAARGDKKEIESLQDLDEHIEQLRALGYLE